MKLVSVVVATYKRENDLKRALESLAVQSYPNIEIVLVDDNGETLWNKKVLNVVDEFRKKFPTVFLNYIVNNPNQGSAKTRNIGIEASHGDYITFLDDDDVYMNDKIKKQEEFMEKGDYDYSITDLILYNKEDKVVDRRIREYIDDTSVSSLRLFHLKYHMTGTDTMMFKKEYLTRIGGFDLIDVGDEFFLMQKAIEAGGKFGYLPGCDVKAYVHTGDNGGLSSGESKINGEKALYNYKKNYFNKLATKDVQYIKMRHYAVIAYAELRRKQYMRFVCNALKSFFSSPYGFFLMLK